MCHLEAAWGLRALRWLVAFLAPTVDFMKQSSAAQIAPLANGSRRRTYALVRPYANVIRNEVATWLSSLSYQRTHQLEAGTPDQAAAEWIENLHGYDLLVLPFHVHLDANGNKVDGMGVVRLLGDLFLARRIPMLMPVSTYSLQGSFPRALQALAEDRPRAHALLVPVSESNAGDPVAAAALERLAAARTAALAHTG